MLYKKLTEKKPPYTSMKKTSINLENLIQQYEELDEQDKFTENQEGFVFGIPINLN